MVLFFPQSQKRKLTKPVHGLIIQVCICLILLFCRLEDHNVLVLPLMVSNTVVQLTLTIQQKIIYKKKLYLTDTQARNIVGNVMLLQLKQLMPLLHH